MSKEKKKHAPNPNHTMRRIATVLYVALYVIQLLMLRVWVADQNMGYQGLISVPFLLIANLILLVVMALAVLGLVTGKGRVSDKRIRIYVATTAMVIAFELLVLNLQSALLGMMVNSLFSSLNPSDIVQYVMAFGRMVLMILAAFFVLSSREEYGPAEPVDAADDDEPDELDEDADDEPEEDLGEEDEEEEIEVKEETEEEETEEETDEEETEPPAEEKEPLKAKEKSGEQQDDGGNGKGTSPKPRRKRRR